MQSQLMIGCLLYLALAPTRLDSSGIDGRLEHMENISRIESVDALCALRRKVAGIESPKPAQAPVALGCAPLDAEIGGGLGRGRLHELFAAEPADSGSAAGFAALLAYLASRTDGPLFWLREEKADRQGPLHAPGLAQIGIEHPEHRARALAIGERLEVLKDYPTSPGCTSPYAPDWINEMVRRKQPQ